MQKEGLLALRQFAAGRSFAFIAAFRPSRSRTSREDGMLCRRVEEEWRERLASCLAGWALRRNIFDSR
jgi:hypothetical protein